MTLGLALVHRPTAAERDRRQKLLAEVSDVLPHRGNNLGDLPLVNVCLARERARRGDRDEAIPLMRTAVDHLFRGGQLLAWGIPAMGVLVETLLDRRADGDVAEAEAAIERLAAAPADEGLVMREIWLLRLRALLARAHDDCATTRTSGIATATWRKRLASKDISRGPRRCYEGDRKEIRFKCEAAFARHAGVAQIPVWSGNIGGRVRMTRSGNRQLKCCPPLLRAPSVPRAARGSRTSCHLPDGGDGGDGGLAGLIGTGGAGGLAVRGQRPCWQRNQRPLRPERLNSIYPPTLYGSPDSRSRGLLIDAGIKHRQVAATAAAASHTHPAGPGYS